MRFPAQVRGALRNRLKKTLYVVPQMAPWHLQDAVSGGGWSWKQGVVGAKVRGRTRKARLRAQYPVPALSCSRLHPTLLHITLPVHMYTPHESHRHSPILLAASVPIALAQVNLGRYSSLDLHPRPKESLDWPWRPSQLDSGTITVRASLKWPHSLSRAGAAILGNCLVLRYSR